VIVKFSNDRVDSSPGSSVHVGRRLVRVTPILNSNDSFRIQRSAFPRRNGARMTFWRHRSQTGDQRFYSRITLLDVLVASLIATVVAFSISPILVSTSLSQQVEDLTTLLTDHSRGVFVSINQVHRSCVKRHSTAPLAVVVSLCISHHQNAADFHQF
jgi:hypothetical protein